VVRQERPGVDQEGAGLPQGGEAGHEIGPVHVICEEGPALESAHHHMVEHVGRIQAGLPGHGEEQVSRKRNNKQHPASPARLREPGPRLPFARSWPVRASQSIAAPRWHGCLAPPRGRLRGHRRLTGIGRRDQGVRSPG